MEMKEIVDILKKVNEFVEWENEKGILTNGIVDSVELLEVVTELESTFQIEIDIDDISPENFDSIEAIAKMIEKLSSSK